jgi:putative tryptophan/tyrosine transport system substrate-binding protein
MPFWIFDFGFWIQNRIARMRAEIFFLALCAPLVVFCLPAEAQQPKKIPRIGYLSSSSPSSAAASIDTFRQGLRDLGYTEGKNILIEYRYAEGKLDRLPALAGELIGLKVDLIVASGGATLVEAARKATATIPIVMTSSADPVGTGLVASLARPGGNVTGLSTLALELGDKRLELLKEVVPNLTRVGILGGKESPSYARQMKEIEIAAKALGVRLQPVHMRGADDLKDAFASMTKERAAAVMTLITPIFSPPVRAQIADLAIKSRLPTMFPQPDAVEAGGLMAYGPDNLALHRRAATYVDKILKGAKPAELPVEQPKKFEFIVNLKAAKEIGLTIPPNVLARADKVIK